MAEQTGILSKFTPEYVTTMSYNLEQYWSARTTKINRLYDVLELKDTYKSPIFESVVDNEPSVMIKMAAHLLAQLPHRTRVLVDPLNDDEVERAGRSERAMQALWKQIDENRHLSGKFKMQTAKMMLITGWRHVRYWFSNEDGGPPLHVMVDSPLEAFPMFANEKLIQYVNRYKVTLQEAQYIAKGYGVDLRVELADMKQVVTISDFYELVHDGNKMVAVNCISWNNHEYGSNKPGNIMNYIRAPYIIEGRDSLPIISGPIGGHPDRARINWQAMVGESFLDANLELYTKGDKWLSAYAQFAKEQARPILLYKDIEIPEKADAEATKDTRARDGMDIETSSSPTTSPDIKVVQVQSNTDLITFLMQMMSGMKQRGSFPYITFGGLQQELSGFAITQLFKAIYYKLSDFIDAINMDFRRIEKDFLLWARGSSKSIVLQAPIRQSSLGTPSEEVWNSKLHIPQGTFDVEVTQRLNMPDTLAQRIQTARAAVPGNMQLLPLSDIFEKVLEEDDPARLEDGIKANMVKFDPLEGLIDKWKAYKLQARELSASGDDESNELAQIYEALAAAIYARLIGPQRGQAPQQNTEMPPGTLPPEASGMSTDAVRAATGINRGAPNQVS